MIGFKPWAYIITTIILVVLFISTYIYSDQRISDLLAFLSLLIAIITLFLALEIKHKFDLDRIYKSDEYAAVKEFVIQLSQTTILISNINSSTQHPQLPISVNTGAWSGLTNMQKNLYGTINTNHKNATNGTPCQ